ncbi:hypothetical protein ACES2L_10015 [Bdellovibrio bacteriovorus]
MKKYFMALAIFSFCSATYAQKIKVRKVKGKQAIIEFTGGNLESGRVYELAPDEFGESSVTTSSRNYVVSIEGLIQSLKADTTGAENEMDISLTARFGWNHGSYEFGPLGSYTSDAEGATTTTLISGGGFFDYNLIPNTPGEAFIYGAGATGTFGQYDDGSNASTVMTFFGGVFAKWFPTGSNVGFRIDGGYLYGKLSGDSSSTTTGFKTSLGLLGYF